MKYKRFLLFQYACYYPGGGFNDFTQDFNTREELEKYLIESYKCSQNWQGRCDKCREMIKSGNYDNLHQWEDVNKVEDLIGNEDFDVNDFIKNYNKKLDDEDDE